LHINQGLTPCTPLTEHNLGQSQLSESLHINQGLTPCTPLIEHNLDLEQLEGQQSQHSESLDKNQELTPCAPLTEHNLEQSQHSESLDKNQELPSASILHFHAEYPSRPESPDICAESDNSEALPYPIQESGTGTYSYDWYL
jgi:hypothetical protein